MQRKRLAVVISQADSTYQRDLLKGLIDEAFRYDFDVCVFTAFIKDGTPEAYQIGEANIYHLINPEKIDGMYICTCDDWQTMNEEAEDGYRTIGYPEKMTQIYTFEGENRSVDPEKAFHSKLMLPRLYEECDKPSVYYLTPLHFNDRSFGYTVPQYINKPLNMQAGCEMLTMRLSL